MCSYHDIKATILIRKHKLKSFWVGNVFALLRNRRKFGLHAFLYKNTENQAEAQIFLTSACYFSIAFQDENFPFEQSNFIPSWIFLEIPKNIEPNFSLDIFIKCILINKKACICINLSHYFSHFSKILKILILNVWYYLKIALIHPAWLEKTLKFTCFALPKIALNSSTMVGERFEIFQKYIYPPPPPILHNPPNKAIPQYYRKIDIPQ